MKEFQFLSQIDSSHKKSIIDACRNHLKLLKRGEEKTILSKLLNDFLANDFSFLSPQEINFMKSSNQNKWAGYLAYRWKFKNQSTTKKAPTFPLYVLIEPTSLCNLRCSMCFQMDTRFFSDKKIKGMMDFNLFTKVVDEAAAGGTKALTLASRGEPTLHPLFGKMLEYCRGKFYETKINTNALELNERLSRQILESGVSMVVFSMDAYDSKGYAKIRNSSKFSHALKNIKTFHRIRKKQFPDSITTTRAHGVQMHADFDAKKFYSFWNALVDEVTLINYTQRWDTYNNRPVKNKKPCSFLFDRMYVWHDGTCNPCDVDYKSYLTIGNAKKQTIKAIWNARKYRKLRETHVSGCRLSLTPCDRCEL